MYTPPGTPRSRSLTRFTIRVGLEHLGQSVLLVVSISFLRSPVFAIFAIVFPISFCLAVRFAAFLRPLDLAPFAAAGLARAIPEQSRMNGKFGPETSRSSRGSLPNLVYTKPRVPHYHARFV